MKPFKPMRDRVLVKRLESADRTPGGIIIPDNAKEKATEGIVVAVGTGERTSDGKLHPLSVQKGDKVMFSKYAGTTIEDFSENHVLIREDDIFCVIE